MSMVIIKVVNDTISDHTKFGNGSTESRYEVTVATRVLLSSTQRSWEYRTAGHLVFWKPWPAVELKKVPSVTKHGFLPWAQRKPNTRLEICKAFQDRLTFLNRHMIVKISWNLSILWNLLRITDCWPFSVLKTLTGSQAEKCHKTWLSVNQTLDLRSVKLHFRIAWLF